MKVAVVGLGVAGHIAAHWLLQHAIKPHIFTDKKHTGCAPVAAAMLAPIAELDTSEKQIFTLGLNSLSLWQALVTRLGIPHACATRGSIMVAHQVDENELLHMRATVSRKLGQQTEQHLQMLDAHALHTLEPALLRFHRALYFPHEGYINNQLFLDASERALLQEASIKNTFVQNITPHHITTTDGTEGFDWVIDCRGLGAQAQMTHLRGVRGEVIRVHAPEVRITRPVRLAHPRYKLYVVPRPNQHYIVGATEIEAHDDSPPSVRSCLELLSAAFSLDSHFAEARIVDMRTASRPTWIDNNPYTDTEQGLIRINGLYRHGYLIAPALISSVLSNALE